MWMFSCRCWESSSTLLRYTRDGRLLHATPRICARRCDRRLRGRDLRLPLLDRRAVAPGLLSGGGHDIADRARHGAGQQQVAGALDPARPGRADLLIVARASQEDVDEKLRRAGANRVVQPYSTAGKEMATLVLQPQVAAFLDAASATGGSDLRFEEIEVTPTCDQAGKTIREIRVRHETGAVIIALRKHDGTFDTTPSPDVRLEAGDVMIAVGSPDELRLLEELFAPREALAP